MRNLILINRFAEIKSLLNQLLTTFWNLVFWLWSQSKQVEITLMGLPVVYIPCLELQGNWLLYPVFDHSLDHSLLYTGFRRWLVRWCGGRGHHILEVLRNLILFYPVFGWLRSLEVLRNLILFYPVFGRLRSLARYCMSNREMTIRHRLGISSSFCGRVGKSLFNKNKTKISPGRRTRSILA